MIQKKIITESVRKIAAMEPQSRAATRDTLSAMMAGSSEPAEVRAKRWRLMAATPKNGPLWKILGAFERETDIPLEVPFFCVIHLVSGWLLSKGVRLCGQIGEIGPELWTIVLADSGSGKTLAHKVLAKAAPVQSSFPECNSGAAFIDSFIDHNNTLWFQDEFAQTLKEIENKNSPMADIRKYLLRAYDNEKIERKTKKGTVTIESPRLGVLGLNTPESFLNALGLESLMDGFAQRFALVEAPADKDRPMRKFACYNIPVLETAAQEAFDTITALTIHPRYEIGPEAMEAFKSGFDMMFRDDVPKSFYRRIQFRGFKYALFYHVLLGKESAVIDAEDMAWGATLSAIHMEDMVALLQRKSELAGVSAVAKKARGVMERLALAGKPVTARALVHGVWHIQNTATARTILDLMPEPKQPPTVANTKQIKRPDLDTFGPLEAAESAEEWEEISLHRNAIRPKPTHFTPQRAI
jgi:hypothetical protein